MRQSDLIKIQRYAATGFGWIVSPTTKVVHQFLRYAVVVGVAYSVDIALLIFLIEVAGLHYLTAVAIAYVAGLVVKYLLSIFWVFNSTQRLDNKYVEFIIFVIIGVAGLGFNEILMWICIGLMQIHYLASKIMSSGFTILWNFFIRKFILFR